MAKFLRHSVQSSLRSARLSAALVPKWVEYSRRFRIEFVSWVSTDWEFSCASTDSFWLRGGKITREGLHSPRSRLPISMICRQIFRFLIPWREARRITGRRVNTRLRRRWAPEISHYWRDVSLLPVLQITANKGAFMWVSIEHLLSLKHLHESKKLWRMKSFVFLGLRTSYSLLFVKTRRRWG